MGLLLDLNNKIHHHLHLHLQLIKLIQLSKILQVKQIKHLISPNPHILMILIKINKIIRQIHKNQVIIIKHNFQVIIVKVR